MSDLGTLWDLTQDVNFGAGPLAQGGVPSLSAVAAPMSPSDPKTSAPVDAGAVDADVPQGGTGPGAGAVDPSTDGAVPATTGDGAVRDLPSESGSGAGDPAAGGSASGGSSAASGPGGGELPFTGAATGAVAAAGAALTGAGAALRRASRRRAG